jgi:hypothetical protein
MKKKKTQREERKIRAQKIKKIIETPIDYTFDAQESRFKLEQPTP